MWHIQESQPTSQEATSVYILMTLSGHMRWTVEIDKHYSLFSFYFYVITLVLVGHQKSQYSRTRFTLNVFLTAENMRKILINQCDHTFCVIEQFDSSVSRYYQPFSVWNITICLVNLTLSIQASCIRWLVLFHQWIELIFQQGIQI